MTPATFLSIAQAHIENHDNRDGELFVEVLPYGGPKIRAKLDEIEFHKQNGGLTLRLIDRGQPHPDDSRSVT